MTRLASLLVVALALGFLAVGSGIAEAPDVSTDLVLAPAMDPVVDRALETDLVCSSAEPQAEAANFGQIVFLPTTTGIRACTESEQAFCGFGCPCIFIFPSVRCFC